VLNLDPAKLFVILVVAFLVLGPERLPKVARQLGGAWRELTRIRNEVTDEVRAAFPVDDLPHIPHIPNATSAVSSFVSGFTQPIRSSLGGTLSTTNGTETATAEEVVTHVDRPVETWRTVADDDDDESRDWSGRTQPVTDLAGFHPLEDWSLYADDPSMN
jgi:Sec-independent protein translocase protein TatA